MNYVNPVNIAIISLNNSTTEYYTQFFNLKQYDNILHLDKRSFNIEKFKNFQPEIILIDDYFNCDNNEEIINKSTQNWSCSEAAVLSTVYAADLLAMFDKALILPSIISRCREMQMDNLVGDNLLKSQVIAKIFSTMRL